jgi:predicted DNA-binding transcriptional regulator AlpA
MEDKNMRNLEKRWLDIKEAADRMTISHRTLYNRTGLKSKNPFPVRPKRVGRRLIFDVKEIDAFMESL